MRTLPKIDVNYNAIFYSAFKSLIIFEMLLESPKTFEQLQSALMDVAYIKSSISKDTLRVYINSFKQIGCNVEKILTGEKHREYAFHIPENPFKPQISQTQISRLFEIYDFLMYNLPFNEFLQLERLLRKIKLHTTNNEFFEETHLKHSLIKDFDFNLLEELEQCCHSRSLVTVLYNSPRSGHKEIPIIAHKMLFQNYKLYLNGFGMEYRQETIFPIERILEIVDVKDSTDIEVPENSFEIICELYDTQVKLLPTERLLSENNGIRTISHPTDNVILSKQRFLQLADRCKILEPKGFRDYFVNTLKATKESYDYGK